MLVRQNESVKTLRCYQKKESVSLFVAGEEASAILFSSKGRISFSASH